MSLQSQMSAMELSTDDIRRKLKADLNIDHIVELQIIVAVLLENEIDESSDIFSDFTNYFNEFWNLQFLTKTKNTDKNRKVLTYICWKFRVIQKKQARNDGALIEISNILSFYNEKRTEIKHHFNEKENSEDYLKIEESLFNFLNEDKEISAPISIVDFIIKSKEVEKKYSNLYNIDHIVEFQILKFVLVKKKVDSDDLKFKFVKYFHKIWNFKILTKKENISKGHAVKKWIKFIKGNSKSCSDEICERMKLIFDHYRKNISTIKTYIENDETNTDRKNQLLELVDYLNELFEKNIPIDRSVV